jgi:hypothetical protein
MIFLSYAKEDSERASKIFSLLNRSDRPVFFDKQSLLPGMDWEQEIEEKLGECKLILILCSKYSVVKEGFIQREIKLALKRAEYMPDGRIFIIPVRFDEVSVPRNLSKYHWIDIIQEQDLYDVQFYIDILWDRISVTGNSAYRHGSSDKILLRENVVVLLQGRNMEGHEIYSYLQLPLWKLSDLRNTMVKGEDFTPSSYGTVLEQGTGQPSEELKARMATEHNMIGVPSKESVIETLIADYMHGFAEGYRSVLGDHVEIPIVNPPNLIPPNSTSLREGIKRGIIEPNERKSTQ